MPRLLLVLAAALALAGGARAASPPPTGDVEPDWLHKPGPYDLRAVFPVGLHGPGRAVLRCRVNIEGLLEDCRVTSESPPGKGVGAAALLLVPNFQMRPAVRAGQPAKGTVNIPILFDGGVGSYNGSTVEALVHPLWLQAPTQAEVAAAYPRRGPAEGHAAMRCELKADGRLRECVVLSEEPPYRGFGEVAKKLAPRFRALTDPARFEHSKVLVTVPFALEAQPPSPRYITAPDWRAGPTPAQTLALYPDKALKDGIRTGRGRVECRIQPDGALADCKAESEEPAGEGFGEAAVRLAGLMAIGAWSQDGRPVDGAHIRIPVRFNYAGPEAAGPQPH